jgi:hypothetical protein
MDSAGCARRGGAHFNRGISRRRLGGPPWTTQSLCPGRPRRRRYCRPHAATRLCRSRPRSRNRLRAGGGSLRAARSRRRLERAASGALLAGLHLDRCCASRRREQRQPDVRDDARAAELGNRLLRSVVLTSHPQPLVGNRASRSSVAAECVLRHRPAALFLRLPSRELTSAGGGQRVYAS